MVEPGPHSPAPSGTGPLAGVRVLDLSGTFSGPYCTRQLADLGAEVLKVEAPGGDVTRSLGSSREPSMASVHVAVNRDKATVGLDLTTPSDAALLCGLVERSDCLVHNLRAPAAARLGIDARTALELNPRLVHVTVTGFGSDGPLAGRPAYDDVVQARAGLAWLQGLPRGAPEYVASAVADKLAGILAAQAALAALYEREHSGCGQAVEVPMFESLVGFTLMEQWGGRAFVPPTGPTGYARMRSPHRRPYRTADGTIAVVVYHEGHWRRFLTAVGRAELLDDERFATATARNDNIDALYEILAGLLEQHDTAHWLELLAGIDVPAGPVPTLDEVFDDPQLRDTGYFQPVTGADGERYLAARPAARFSRTPPPEPADRPGPTRPDGGRAVLHRWLDGPTRTRPAAAPRTGGPAPGRRAGGADREGATT